MNETVKKILERIVPIVLGLVILGVGGAAVFGVICLFAWLFQVLPPVGVAILAILFVIGANVVAYFESYVWESRKSWYFPLALCVTVAGVIVFLSTYLG